MVKTKLHDTDDSLNAQNGVDSMVDDWMGEALALSMVQFPLKFWLLRDNLPN